MADGAHPGTEVSVLVIGAGFGGLAAAFRLREAGFRDVVVLEKADRPGGTWRENTYPGVACDVQSHLYSLSFAPKADWSRRYAHGDEIQAYIERDVVARFGLGPHLRLGREVVSASWDEQAARWWVRTAGGETWSARYVVSATGPLHVPSMPDVPGLASFRGKVMHSARWDSHHDLTGARVASIGTGASAIQYIPAIAPRVSRLHVFQRTPAWVLPRDDRAYSPAAQWAFAHVPGARAAHRAALYWRNEARMLPLAHARLARALQGVAAANLRRQVRDPEVARRLTPNETIGCRRALLSNDYYPAFDLPHVELVTEPIARFTENAVITSDGAVREVDAVVCGTGFVVDPRRYLERMPIQGRGGLTLGEAWRDGARAYLGISIPRFPNLFQLVGPNTGLGHNSILFMIEAQLDHVVAVLAASRARGVEVVEARPEALDRFDRVVQDGLKGTVWASGCKSWYQQPDGRNFSIWPFATWRYWLAARSLVAEDYTWGATGA